MTPLDRLKRALQLPVAPITRAGRARRRFNCGDQERWDERAQAAVELWVEGGSGWRPPGGLAVRIADLGAGNERLRNLLASRLADPHEYLPYDLHPQRPTTSRVDLAEGLPADPFDVAFCLGVIEYLPLTAFLERLRDQCRFAIVSYAIADAPDRLTQSEREARGWRSHLTSDEFERELSGCGFARKARVTVERERTGIWLLE
jgi:hypothetical protein